MRRRARDKVLRGGREAQDYSVKRGEWVIKGRFGYRGRGMHKMRSRQQPIEVGLEMKKKVNNTKVKRTDSVGEINSI